MDHIEALKKGEQHAFIQVLELYHPRTFRFFYKRVKDVTEAQELTQQCFIRLWEFRALLSLEFSLERQIFAIAKSLWLNYLKKEDVQKRLKQGWIQTNRLDVAHILSVADKDNFEARNFMDTVLDQLSPIQRKILQMKFVSGYTNKEISQELSLSIKTVEGHVSKAYGHLREIVDSF